MKLKSTIITLISIVIVAVSGIMVYIYWPAITGTVTNNQYLTPEQGQAMYNKGYADGNKSEEEQLSQIEYYKNLADEYYIQFGIYNNEINSLNGTVTSNNQTIQELTTQKNNLQQQVVNLQTVQTQNENTIQELNSQIILLQAQADQIPGLNTQITNLQVLVTQLQTTNQINADTITSLNTQIVSLNNQIRELSATSQNASARITALTNRCNELQASINYYESFISTQENSTQAVATYEVDGAVWKIEIVNKGEIVLPQFTDTATLIFNGWTVNDTLLGSTYTINANTKFVASVVHKYSVQFMTDDVVYNSQYIFENEYATVPTAPTKNGYDFLGWSLNGVDIVNDINTTAVVENVIYHAVFEKVHTVTFMADNQVLDTQSISHGCTASDVNVLNLLSDDFVGWKVNNNVVNVLDYQIFDDTVFVAYGELTKWVKIEDFEYLGSDTNVRLISPSNIWNDGVSYYFTVYSKSYFIDFNNKTYVDYSFGGNVISSGVYIWNYKGDVYYSNLTEQYKLNKLTQEFESYSWNRALSYVKCLGGKYYSYSNGNIVVLDENSDTWKNANWNSVPTSDLGSYWFDGETLFCSEGSKHFKFNVETNTWVSIMFKTVTDYIYTNNLDASFYGRNVWECDNNLYVSNSGGGTYKINTKTLKVYSMDDFGLKKGLSIGNDIYYFGGTDNTYLLVSENLLKPVA